MRFPDNRKEKAKGERQFGSKVVQYGSKVEGNGLL